MDGWIKLHRSFLKWEWFRNPNTRLIFEYCLLRANWEDERFEGEVIKKGSFVTSLKNMADDNGITVDQTRTALKHLESTKEITKVTTSRYTLIILNNWEKYQGESQSNSQTNPKQIPNESQQYKNKRTKEHKNVITQFDQRPVDYDALQKKVCK